MDENAKGQVKRRYAEVALSVREGGGAACCCSEGQALDFEAPGVDWTGGSYSEDEKRKLRRPPSRLLWGVATWWRSRRSPLARLCRI